MKLSDFDFDLPEDLIALRPLKPRPASRMLHAVGFDLTDRHVQDLTQVLRAGDVLVLNDTRVIPARLFGERVRETTDGSGRAKIEATLTKRLSAVVWEAMAKPGRKLREGDRLEFAGAVTATLRAKHEGGFVEIAFDLSGPELDAAIAQSGSMPLPPYIAAKRAADGQDHADYQTVFARNLGAVAAPTASLHFDDALLEELGALGVEFAFVTLHVGAGTFLPVSVDRIEDHKMHSEWGYVSDAAAAQIQRALDEGRRVIPVGTTAMRLIESAATAPAQIAPWEGETDIFIKPGYAFKVASGLMTNFHLPKSTLMMLVSALLGVEETRALYDHAIASGYRFYSYGDSSLLFPKK